jgi:membrane-bound serine protease (ClpP class)
MQRRWLGILLLWLLAALAATEVRADEGLLVDIKGPIGPAVESFVLRAFDEAKASDAPFVLLRIDTPGGLASSTRGIVSAILKADRPVIGYVAPTGARAASAGAYILMATHVAAMAPVTTIGSATPISLGGGSPSPPMDKEDGEKTPTATDKVLNDAKAYMRSLAATRGRSVGAAERFVSAAANVTAGEALEQGLIDLQANSARSLLNQIDGRMLTVNNLAIQLETAEVDLRTFEPTWRDRLLAFISNPNIAYLLLIAGIYGLIIEGSNPGLIVPGILGAIALFLGLYALQVLPVNYAGLALIALGIGLMIAEALVPAFGAMGLGGIVCFVLGSIMLIDTDIPEFKLSPVLIGAVALVNGGLFLIVLSFAVRAWRRSPVSGIEAMAGLTGKVIEWNEGRGRVLTHGEVWSAVGPQAIDPESSVEIEHVDGLTLHVRPRTSKSIR